MKGGKWCWIKGKIVYKNVEHLKFNEFDKLYIEGFVLYHLKNTSEVGKNISFTKWTISWKITDDRTLIIAVEEKMEEKDEK